MPDYSASRAEARLESSVSLISRTTFCVSGERGDLYGGGEQGLFYRDMRHLSRFVLLVNGEPPEPVSHESNGDSAEFFSSVPAGVEQRGVSVIRRRYLADSPREDLRLSNHTRNPVDLLVELELDADFADLFRVRGIGGEQHGSLEKSVSGDTLSFDYRRGDFRRATGISFDSDGDAPDLQPGCARWRVWLEPGHEWSVRVAIRVEEDGTRPAERGKVDTEPPALETDHTPLARGWERSVADLASLRFRPSEEEGEVLAAGAPWYMALFGRDALISAYQSLILDPEIARSTLHALARRQATERDDFRDAEPGKILHELRCGELARFGAVPHSPYYGTVDATPLFLVLLHETWRWTADESLVRELEVPARRALAWILDHSDSNDDGYTDYETRSSAGLPNQGWKDSTGCILFSDGSVAEAPVALCEAQGYVYDALLRTAELSESIWGDRALARDLRERAESLKLRFDRDFWMPERAYYALALDGRGRQVDSLTSNSGHLLWSGIVPEEKADAVAASLMSDSLYSGWGVRTMAATEGGYDPLSYHNGSVWPHDNALISEGLRRYGYREDANRIALSLVEAAAHFGYRLPEVFAGHDRRETGFPVEYPTSCSPQAWAAGAIPLALRSMLGLDPEPEARRLTTDPALPDGVSRLRLTGVPAFGERHVVEGRA